MARRALRAIAVLATIAAVLVTLVFGAIIILPRTPWGMERARRFALSWLDGQITGQVTIERVSGDGLLSMATLAGIVIADTSGQAFIRADSLSGRYDILDLLRGRVVISSADLWGARVNVERLPGESGWNYDRIFRGEDDGDGGGPSRLIRFDNVRVHDAQVEVVQPLANGEIPSGFAARYVTRAHPSGRLQVMRFEGITAAARHVIWSRPGNKAHEIDIEMLAADVGIFPETFSVHGVRGRVVIQDSIVSLDVSRFRLPSSEGAVSGRVVNGSGPTLYDLNIEGEAVEAADIGWLDPRVPSSGSASFGLRIASEPTGDLRLQFRDIRFEAEGTRVSGTFGYLTGNRPALNDVDLDVSSLDLVWAQTEFTDTVRLDGSVSGRIRANGPLSSVRTSGNLRLRRTDEPPTDVQWAGNVRMDGIVAANGLGADITGLDLALLDRFMPGIGLAGQVEGRVEADGRLRDGITLRTVLRHRLAVTSVLDGGGTIRRVSDRTALDLSFDAEPLRLETIATLIEGLDSLRGPAAGRITLSGTTDSLVVSGDVQTDGGPLAFRGLVDRRADLPRFDVTARSPSFTPERVGLYRGEAVAAGELTTSLSGKDLRSLRGPLLLDIDSALVNGIPVERSSAAARFDAGRIVVDSTDVRVPGLRIAASGGIGLVPERSDSLRLIIDSESLEPFERILFEDVADPTQPRVGGRGRAVLSLVGSIDAFDAAIEANLEDILYDGRTLESARFTGEGTGFLTDGLRYSVSVRADSVTALDGFADSLHASLERAGPTGQIRLSAWRDTINSVAFESAFELTPTGSLWHVLALGFESGPGTWTLAEPADVVVEGRTASIRDLRILPSVGGEVVATGILAWSPGEAGIQADPALDFDLDLTRVPFGLVPSVLRPEGDVRGAIEGSMHIGGLARSPTITGSFDITGVEYEGADLDRVELRARYADLLLDLTVVAFLNGAEVLNGSGGLPLDLRFGPTGSRLLDRPMTASMVMERFPAAFMLGFTSGFSNVEGAFQGSIEANGNARSPELSGALVLVGGAATWDATGVRYVDAEGTFLMDRELTAGVDFTARTVNPRSGTRGGTARMRGQLDLSKPTDPGFDLTIIADRIQAAQRRDMEIIASGNVDISGQYTRPEIGGDVTINGGTLYLDELYRQYLIVRLEDPLLFDVVDTTFASGPRVLPKSMSPFIRNLLIQDMNVTVGSGSWLRGREINLEVAGELTVLYDRQADDLRMSGTLNAIRGTYRLEYPPITRNFDVREGTVEFPGTPGIDPNLNITAVYTAPRTGDEPLDIYAQVTGTLQSPRVNLSSDAQPPISESDLASYLFLGAPTYAFNVASSSGVFGNLGRQVLTNTGLGYFASGLQTLGQSFGLIDYVGLSAAETAPGQSNAGFLSGTKIELGRYLTPRLFVTYVQRLNSTSNDPGVRLEWRFTDTFTMEVFSLDRFARAPSFGLSRAIAARRELGFFLFREWGY